MSRPIHRQQALTLTRLRMLALVLLATLTTLAALALPDRPAQAAGDPHGQGALRFPQDEGAHPDWKTEWWYVTGWVNGDDGKPLGFQVTFFRNRGPAGSAHASRFAPQQLLLGHAALSDPAHGGLRQGERALRSGFGLAEARIGDLHVQIDDWHLQRAADGGLDTHVDTGEFALDLHFQPVQPPLLQGQAGRSQKGADRQAFSWYYSLPHLRTHGTVQWKDQAARAVQGEAWLDHEWSDAYVSPGAVGWDWTGLNFLDGSALMAFRMRSASGSTLWSAATWRDASGRTELLPAGRLELRPGRLWQSPRTGARYPVEFEIRWPGHQLHLQPLQDAQEYDARASTGTAYWEGAVRAFDSRQQPVAQGYLELTGYWKPLQF